MKIMMIKIYSLLGFFALFVFQVSRFFSPKINSAIREREEDFATLMVRIKNLDANKKNLWLHAASAGEYEQIKPVLDEIDRSRWNSLLTVFSPTIYKHAKKDNRADVVTYLPFDTRKNAHQFVRLISPEKWVISRHDLWPNHLIAAKKFGTKIAIINANLHENSMRFMLKSFHHNLFKNLDVVFTMNEKSAKRWAQLCNDEKVFVIGDTRFDQIVRRKRMFSGFAKMEKSNGIVFASLLKSDEPAVFPVVEKLLQNETKRLIVLVPHEPDKKTIQRYVNFLEKNKRSYSRWSDFQKDRCVLLVDIVGVLPDIYHYSKIAYIGGGFGAGVHSVIEPAVYENFIAFGPNFGILEEAVELVNLGFCQVVKTSESLLAFINESREKDRNADVLSFVNKRTGVSDKILEWINNENK